MYPRTVLLLLFFCVVFCLAEETTESTTGKNSGVPIMSEAAILLTVTACVTTPVLGILLSSMFYYKFCEGSGQNEVV